MKFVAGMAVGAVLYAIANGDVLLVWVLLELALR